MGKRPSIVLIVADDLGYGDVGAYRDLSRSSSNSSATAAAGEPARSRESRAGRGSRDQTGSATPNIDALGRDGILFTDGYVTAPVCSPSRAGLMTGRYQQRFGHEFNSGPLERDIRMKVGLPLSETLLAQVVKQSGYVTGLVGKWHIGMEPPYRPLRRGFDEFFGFLFGGPYIDAGAPGVHSVRTFEEGPFTPKRDPRDAILRGDTPVDERGYLTEAFTREALSFIERHRREPFFLCVAYKTPHTPLQATEQDWQRFPAIREEPRRVYAAMVAALDDGIGRILAALGTAGLARETLVIFLSDNGGALYTHAASNGPLREGKYSLMEGGIRVPFMVRWPARLAPGRLYRQPVSALDIFPTVLAAAGCAPPARPPLDGVNLLPYLEGAPGQAPGPHEVLFWRVGSNAAVRRGNWKLFKGGESIVWLYDLAADSGETRNLAAQHPEIVQDLTKRLAAWNAQLAKPLWPASRTVTVPVEGGTLQVDM